ncbi:hypothetical protein MIMGU_mgv1a000270mg [Erythranthe guttata]|uniref:PHD-type domain-containing protein n=1 Tax=Erythranthe guttata TaxID=4155 RepID=A0A022Q6Q2_ERYGU|nr:hypothetical protein MIMGU_mgv1a000270mg [Erythranthe guttata]
MTGGGRCQKRRKSMAGGRGTAVAKKIDTNCKSPNIKPEITEKPLGSLEITKIPHNFNFELDLFTQARKALSFRSPFDSEDSQVPPAFVSSANTLPSSVSHLLGRQADSRKRHKKLHSGSDKKSSTPGRPRVSNIWVEVEEYFRELTVEDVDQLHGASSIEVSSNEKCFLIPSLKNDDNSHYRYDIFNKILESACEKDSLNLGNSAPLNSNGELEFNEMAAQQDDGPHSMDVDSVEVESRELEINEENNGEKILNTEKDSISFNGVEWLLGSRSKIYLASERPSKKRKLLGRDAGLEKLLVARPVEGVESVCHYCSYADTGNPLNLLIKCSSCGMVVHQRCYGVQEDVDGSWMCSWCKRKNVSDLIPETPCLLCPKKGGALKPVEKRGSGSENEGSEVEFAHLFCCQWMPEVYMENTRTMEPVMNMDDLKDTRRKMICYLCKVKCGACVRCSNGSCRTSFHPICAREARHRMEIWGKLGSDEVELRAFCSKHSEVQYDIGSQDAGDVSLTGTFVSHVSKHQDIALKLIDLGKVSAEDVASEIGVPPDSLNTILTDNHIVPELQNQLLGWFKNHAHIDHPQRTLKVKNRSLVTSKDVADVAEGDGTVPLEDSSVSDAVPVKSVPPRRRTKSSIRTVISNLCSSMDKTNDEKIETDAGEDSNGPSRDSFPDEKLANIELLFVLSLTCFPFCIMTMTDKLRSAMQYFSEDGLDGETKHSQQMTRCSLVLTGREASQLEASSSSGICCINHNQHATSGNGVNLEQLVGAKNLGMLKLSPADEVEGELIYYQQRILHNAVARKRISDDLISKVVRSLPHEIDAAGKQKWDAVLVSQYNHDLREAKKQGRKERRHKEAQAILAAATAAAAASSRISTIRKDTLEESQQPEVDVSDVKPGLNPRVKETISRSVVARSSSVRSATDVAKGQPRTCDICRRSESVLNPILICSSCKVAVHLDCYRSVKSTTGPWHCELCEDLFASRDSGALATNPLEKPYFVAECGLCGGTAGAFRKSSDGQWIHALCAEWVLESSYRRGQVDPIDGMNSVRKGVDACAVCRRKQGACLKCSYGHCQTTFHPICARSAGFFMTVRTNGGKLQHKAYCEKHSTEQRAKADTQKHGIEEFKSLKQVRVELERLRLLCERIIKREKLKRELVLCSHDILASSRDSVLSALARHPFYQPEVSSESATTSIKGYTDDYKSGETVQKSDGITVDSTVSGKRRVKLPISLDNDQKTDDSSTSQNLYTLKPTDRVSFSGKQIPHRPVASQNLPEDIEQRSRYRKQTETFEKELIMTSDQATMKNQRLPKGFVYVPIRSLSKDKEAVIPERNG